MGRALSNCATDGWSMISIPSDEMVDRTTGSATDDRRLIEVPRVLIADDQPDALEALRLLLKSEGYKIDSAGSPAAILEAVDMQEFDVVLMDLNTRATRRRARK